MNSAILRFIGHINTPYETIEACPRNVDPGGPPCQLVLDKAFDRGIFGLRPGQKILILYWFENTDRNLMMQAPGRGGGPTGTFALRSPHRPNPIGAAELPIESIGDGVITVRGLDWLDGTPLLDIKPAIIQECGSKGA